MVVGIVAISTDLAIAYRLLNAAPFNEYPGQSTVALSAETQARIYAFLGLYLVSMLLECWFLRIIYNCNRFGQKHHLIILMPSTDILLNGGNTCGTVSLTVRL